MRSGFDDNISISNESGISQRLGYWLNDRGSISGKDEIFLFCIAATPALSSTSLFTMGTDLRGQSGRDVSLSFASI
jgi:hypothetical protein